MHKESMAFYDYEDEKYSMKRCSKGENISMAQYAAIDIG